MGCVVAGSFSPLLLFSNFLSLCSYGIVDVPFLLQTNDYEVHIDTATALDGHFSLL